MNFEVSGAQTPAGGLALQAHPTSAGAAPQAVRAVQALDAALGWAADGALELRFRLRAELAALRVPAPVAQPTARDGLWQAMCFEAFIGTEAGPAYHEFNFSPSGEWAIYAFRAERVRNTAAPPWPAPTVACTRAAHELRLHARVARAALPAVDARAPWRLGLSAVLPAASDGALSYWALAHPGAQPDFHHRGGWLARLPQPGDVHKTAFWP